MTAGKLPPSLSEKEFPLGDKPVRSINRKAVYISIWLAVLLIVLVIFLIPKADKQDIKSDEASLANAFMGGNRPETLDKMAKGYGDILQPADEPNEQPNDSSQRKQEKRDASKGANATSGEKAQSKDSVWQRALEREKERAAEEHFEARRSNILFRENSRRQVLAHGSEKGFNRRLPSTSSGGMLFDTGKDAGNNNREPSHQRALQGKRSPYTLMEGTIIPAVLLTEINSGLPGPILAQTTNNIFDSKTGKYLLIPQGSKLIGEYNSNVSFGQERMQITWKRLVLPNTESIDLGRMPGVDATGASGVKGSVDKHYDDLFVGVLATSLLSVGASLSQGPVNPNAVTPQQQIGQSVAQDIERVGTKIIDKATDIPPTIKIAKGTKINVFATTDFLLKPYRDD